MSEVSTVVSGRSKELIDRLASCKVGEQVTYEEIANLLGIKRDDKRLSGAIQVARKVVRREYNFVFGTVRTVGLKRLDDSEIVDVVKNETKSVFRKCRRAKAKLTCANYDGLNREQKTTYNTNLAVLGVVEHATSGKQISTITTRVMDKNSAKLSLAETIEALK